MASRRQTMDKVPNVDKQKRDREKVEKAFGGQNFGDWLKSIPGQIMRQDFGREYPSRQANSTSNFTPTRSSSMRGAWSPAGPGEPSTAEILEGLGLDGGSPTDNIYGQTGAGGFSDLLRLFGSMSGGGGSSAEAAKAKAELEKQKIMQRNLNRYGGLIAGMINDGGYRQQQDALLGELQKQYSAATPTINTAVDALKAQISGQVNPYANMQAQNVEVTPQLQQLLESQGVSATPLQEFASALQAQNQGQATAFNNLAQQLGGAFETGRTGQMTGAEAMRAQALAALEGARAGYGTQLESQAATARNDLLGLLLNAVGQGANVPGLGDLLGVQPKPKNPKPKNPKPRNGRNR
jgi:hypothetical protein